MKRKVFFFSLLIILACVIVGIFVSVKFAIALAVILFFISLLYFFISAVSRAQKAKKEMIAKYKDAASMVKDGINDLIHIIESPNILEKINDSEKGNLFKETLGSLYTQVQLMFCNLTFMELLIDSIDIKTIRLNLEPMVSVFGKEPLMNDKLGDGYSISLAYDFKMKCIREKLLQLNVLELKKAG